jgi:hypothetical protein
MTALRRISLMLARERQHPQGDDRHGYDLYLPLAPDGRIDAQGYRANPAACRVRRFRPGEPDRHGRIVHGPGGQWRFDYDDRGDRDDEKGFRFDSERFTDGEYVSLREDDGQMHTFRVVAVTSA